MTFTNIAFYHFFKIKGFIEPQRRTLKQKCLELGLKGTVLLAREGINLGLSGTSENIEKIKSYLSDWIGANDLKFKESYSDTQPFNRMLVKIKQQLIPVNDPEIDPESFTGPYLSPEELKDWLDQKKDFILLDTRNQFEYKIGTFDDAVQLHMDNFRDYEQRLESAPEEWKSKPIVTFCTGGIRCEKASPLMLKKGFKNVYQLHGGILNYFEKVGGAHWKGDCFVFDQRVAVNSKLEEADVLECFNCRHPVTAEEQKSPHYVKDVSCPYCVHDPAGKTNTRSQSQQRLRYDII